MKQKLIPIQQAATSIISREEVDNGDIFYISLFQATYKLSIVNDDTHVFGIELESISTNEAVRVVYSVIDGQMVVLYKNINTLKRSEVRKETSTNLYYVEIANITAFHPTINLGVAYKHEDNSFSVVLDFVDDGGVHNFLAAFEVRKT